MRIFNRHYRPAKANPQSRLVAQTAESFKRLFKKNPGKYEEIYTEFFGRGGRGDKDPASHYQALVTELALLNTVELGLIKKKVEQASGKVEASLTDEIDRTGRRRAKVERELEGEGKGARYEALETELELLVATGAALRKKKADRQSGKVDRNLLDEIRSVERRREKVARDLKREEKRILRPQGRMARKGGEFR